MQESINDDDLSEVTYATAASTESRSNIAALFRASSRGGFKNPVTSSIVLLGFKIAVIDDVNPALTFGLNGNADSDRLIPPSRLPAPCPVALPARNDGGWQPVHVHGEVVNLPQERIGRNRAGTQYGQQMLGLRFNQDPVADPIECLVLGGGFPSRLRRAGFDGDDFRPARSAKCASSPLDRCGGDRRGPDSGSWRAVLPASFIAMSRRLASALSLVLRLVKVLVVSSKA